MAVGGGGGGVGGGEGWGGGGLNQCLIEVCRDTSLYSQNDLFIIGQA